MSRNCVRRNVSGFQSFVNLALSSVALALIGAGYFAAVGRLAGVA